MKPLKDGSLRKESKREMLDKTRNAMAIYRKSTPMEQDTLQSDGEKTVSKTKTWPLQLRHQQRKTGCFQRHEGDDFERQ
ncbi:hypothetical protein V6N13_073408 [Hibiscus sabdariffa]|uniref:Uncharacterized protein n=1 Tax=Hibiscus sabdariffa TaxID=183260 RepID=A0ABR2BEW9_9ROSI